MEGIPEVLISVITPTIRFGGLEFVNDSLEKQSFKNFEWLIERSFPRGKCDLSASLNRALRRARGELVVMWQDYISADNDALQKFWDKYKELGPKTMITCPVGIDKRYAGLVWDWRKHRVGKIEPEEWETDFAAASLQAFKDVGGYDEQYDNAWSWENADLALRASKAGYSFYCDSSNKATALDHDCFINHPWRSGKTNADLYNTKKSLLNMENSSFPFKLDYL